LAWLLAVNATAGILSPQAGGIAAPAASLQRGSQQARFEGFDCPPALALQFVPPAFGSPAHRSAEVCWSSAPLADVIPAGWAAEAMNASDVFAAAHPRVKRAVAILYGGRRPLVARGWIAREGGVESVTLISPRPDLSVARLAPGTLLIRVVTER
jgi:hypothetical protein